VVLSACICLDFLTIFPPEGKKKKKKKETWGPNFHIDLKNYLELPAALTIINI
jgi:hypothetical protein